MVATHIKKKILDCHAKLMQSGPNQRICPQSTAFELTNIYNKKTILKNKITFTNPFIDNYTNTTQQFFHAENTFPKVYLGLQTVSLPWADQSVLCRFGLGLCTWLYLKWSLHSYWSRHTNMQWTVLRLYSPTCEHTSTNAEVWRENQRWAPSPVQGGAQMIPVALTVKLKVQN